MDKNIKAALDQIAIDASGIVSLQRKWEKHTDDGVYARVMDTQLVRLNQSVSLARKLLKGPD